MSVSTQQSYPSPRPSEGARSLRSKASSDGSSSRGSFGVSIAKYRVGAPPLRPLPLAFDDGDEMHRMLKTRWAEDFIRMAKIGLSHYGVANDHEDFEHGNVSVSFVSRSIPDQPWTRESTVYIVVQKWTDESLTQWEQVVRRLKSSIDSELDRNDQDYGEVSVEMVARDYVINKYMTPVGKNPVLESSWPTIRTKVHGILQAFEGTRDCLTAITLFRFGSFKLDEWDNVLLPVGVHPITVYVSLEYSSDQTCWIPAINSIEAYLKSWPYGLQLHMEHNVVDSFAFELLEPSQLPAERYTPRMPDEYSEQVNMGADLSPSLYLKRSDGERRSSGLGTLGCYVEVQREGSEWVKKAFTNYHVIRPAVNGFRLDVTTDRPLEQTSTESRVGKPEENSDLLITDRDGIYPKDAGRFHLIEQPSRKRHNDFAHELLAQQQSALASFPEPDASQAVQAIEPGLNRKLDFFHEGRHVFGTIYAASGYRRRTRVNSRLDWALIDVKANRIGRNIVPPAQFWRISAQTALIPSAYGASLKPQGKSLHIMQEGDSVFKVGAATYETSGRYSNFKSTINIKEDRHMNAPPSSEHVIIGRLGTPFASYGDSGSVVFDNLGRAVGLVFSGQAPRQSQGNSDEGIVKQFYCLVTPIEDVFEDIMQFSNGKLTGVRIAQ